MKPVCNDHLYYEIYYLWFNQWCVLMKTGGTNLLLLTISACWSSSRWPLAPRSCKVSKTWDWCLEFSNSWTWFLETLQWRQNGCDGVSNHQPRDCLLNRLFRRRSKKTSKLRVTGLCAGISLLTGEFPAQMASNADKVSIWWRHHVLV